MSKVKTKELNPKKRAEKISFNMPRKKPQDKAREKEGFLIPAATARTRNKSGLTGIRPKTGNTLS